MSRNVYIACEVAWLIVLGAVGVWMGVTGNFSLELLTYIAGASIVMSVVSLVLRERSQKVD